MNTTGPRRPIAARNAGWAQRIAAALAAAGVRPNTVSILSMVFGVLAGAAFALSGQLEGYACIAALVASVLGCQFRLLCNLFDGMIAVEGGRAEADGPFWNEFPDRVSDIAIFAGLGYGAGLPELGWAAAALAVLTAYVRELGQSAGAGADFSGPMAKQHRMWVVMVGSLAEIVNLLGQWGLPALAVTLCLIAAGSVITSVRRAVHIVGRLKAGT